MTLMFRSRFPTTTLQTSYTLAGAYAYGGSTGAPPKTRTTRPSASGPASFRRSANGRHERMHLTLKQDATKPAAANVLQQRARSAAMRSVRALTASAWAASVRFNHGCSARCSGMERAMP
jgi:hypothetical protein